MTWSELAPRAAVAGLSVPTMLNSIVACTSPYPMPGFPFAVEPVVPVTVGVCSPGSNANGWNRSDVTLSFSASDNLGGSGVKEIFFSATGAQPIPATTVTGASAGLMITAEGETTVNYYARDHAGNTEVAKVIVIRIDKTAPVISASRTPAANSGGWNNGDVTANYLAHDEVSGLALASPATGSFIFATERANQSHTFTVTDVAGNTATATIDHVNIDKSAPALSCGSADGMWHSSDVSIACTASESISSLTDSADANFNLMTSAAPGTETAGAATNSRVVCDIAGNCVTTGPVTGNRIDKKAPAITINMPTAGAYLLNQVVTVNFNCTDGGSGVDVCVGTSANGSALDTASIGAKSFTVNASDNVGNSSSPSILNYLVKFAFTGLFDQTKAHKSGSIVPLKIRLSDANGVNVSSAATVVHAVSVVQVGSEASPVVEDAGQSSPDLDFRYDAALGGYIFNLKTTGYDTGSYLMNFVVGGGPTIYSVGFQVRQ